jgi:hypothetical protein
VVPGDVLTLDKGTWTGAVTYTWKWFKSGWEILPELDNVPAYTVKAEDAGYNFSIELTGISLLGDMNAVVYTDALTVAGGPPDEQPVNTVPPSLSSSGDIANVVPGDVLTLDKGTWTGAFFFEYGFTRDGAFFVDKIEAYTVTPEDVGHTIAVDVTAYSISGAFYATASSEGVAVVAAAAEPPVNDGPITIYLGASSTMAGGFFHGYTVPLIDFSDGVPREIVFALQTEPYEGLTPYPDTDALAAETGMPQMIDLSSLLPTMMISDGSMYLTGVDLKPYVDAGTHLTAQYVNSGFATITFTPIAAP